MCARLWLYVCLCLCVCGCVSILAEKEGKIKKKWSSLTFPWDGPPAVWENRVVDHRGCSAVQITNLKFSQASESCATQTRDKHTHSVSVRSVFPNGGKRAGRGWIEDERRHCVSLDLLFLLQSRWVTVSLIERAAWPLYVLTKAFCSKGQLLTESYLPNLRPWAEIEIRRAEVVVVWGWGDRGGRLWQKCLMAVKCSHCDVMTGHWWAYFITH